jgi:hypothetical protein
MASRSHLALLALLLAACAGVSQEKKSTAELVTLSAWLPGKYETGSQDITLNIIKVYAPRIGKNVFYAEESATDNHERVMSQRLLSFVVEEQHGAIIETVYNFTEPPRWRGGLTNKDLFTVAMADDVHTVRGCQLQWVKTKELFSGVRSSGCRDTSTTTTSKAWLTEDALTLGTIEYKKVE